MSKAGQEERATQDRVVKLSTGTEQSGNLGYRYLGKMLSTECCKRIGI